MNKKNILILFVLIFSIISANSQHRLQLRPSIGNGKPFGTDKHIYSSINNGVVIFNHFYHITNEDAIKNRVKNGLQLGLMLEYELNLKNKIGIGMVSGRTELLANVKVPNAYSYAESAGLKKMGVEYTKTYFLNSLFKKRNTFLKKTYCSALIGAYFVNHKYWNHDNSITFLTKDSVGNVVDSATSRSFIINNHGFIASVGLRFGYLNKNNKEKLSITFSYDHGFNKLWQMNTYDYFNYLSDHINTTQIARGSQFKIYLSMPICLYDFEKRK